VGSVGVIKSNPDQSKHLETATLRVMGFELDFVNLRAEEYTDTRIPVMRIGTALEDAMRRDLTINALFYNLNRRTVEDFTGQGIQAHILKP
jgi:tRNA nucleotidyltransferase (CCA-adding enzyme)